MLFLDVESSLGVAHRLHRTITFLSFSLTHRKRWAHANVFYFQFMEIGTSSHRCLIYDPW